MRRLLFLTAWDLGNAESDGIAKKIQSQIKVFEKNGYEVDYTYIQDSYACVSNQGVSRQLGKVGIFRKFLLYYHVYRKLDLEKYGYVYSRYALADYYYEKCLRELCGHGARIIVEIPTYPYKQTLPTGILWEIVYIIDYVFSRRQKKYVERIVLPCETDYLWGIKTIELINGIDFDEIEPRTPSIKHLDDGVINLIMVASYKIWHGLDRLLRGMNDYYAEDRDCTVILHIVGEGDVIADYHRFVDENNLCDYVKFYGYKSGKELNYLYNLCDIGIDSLGSHRVGLTHGSALKSREYMAKGLPFISSYINDGFEESEYVKYFNADESNISIPEVIGFYDRLYGQRNTFESRIELVKSIRDLAATICSMDVVMRTIMDAYE